MRTWLLALCFLICGCKQTIILAQLEANVTPEGDTSGGLSAYAIVNFTKFNSPFRADKKLQLTFSNPEGDTMEIIFSPASDASVQAAFPVGRYEIDGSRHTLTSAFTVGTGTGPTKLTVSGTGGYVDISVLNFTLDPQTQLVVVQDVQGTIYVNLDLGGAGSGTMVVTNAPALQ